MKRYSDYWKRLVKEDDVHPVPFLLGIVALFTLLTLLAMIWVEALWGDSHVSKLLKVILTLSPLIAPHAFLFLAWLVSESNKEESFMSDTNMLMMGMVMCFVVIIIIILTTAHNYERCIEASERAGINLCRTVN